MQYKVYNKLPRNKIKHGMKPIHVRINSLIKLKINDNVLCSNHNNSVVITIKYELVFKHTFTFNINHYEIY